MAGGPQEVIPEEPPQYVKDYHTDLYDQIDIIPFDKLEAFLEKNVNRRFAY